MNFTKLRPLIQWAFFGLFLLTMVMGKAQIWMGLIFLSILLSSFFGRFYCGWMCPINTLIRPVNKLKQIVGLDKKKDVPQFFKSGLMRKIVFGLFLVGLGYTIYTITQGRKFPLPLIIIPVGLLTTLFINEKTWHRYLCPWGVLFSLTGRFAKLGLQTSGCTSCSLCDKTCPGDAITVKKGQGAVVDPTYCLLCFECDSACPVDAFSYESLSNKVKKDKSRAV